MKANRPLVGAGILIVENNRTLLAKRKGSHGSGMWGSAGGHVEFGERPSDTVKREAKEELGIILKNVKFLCCIDAYMSGSHYIDVGFKAGIGKGKPSIQLGEENRIEKVGWFDLNQLPKPLFPPVKIYLKAFKTGQVYFELKRL